LAAGALVTEEIRAAVHNQLGFTVSAGVAANKMLAKLTSGRLPSTLKRENGPEMECLTSLTPQSLSFPNTNLLPQNINLHSGLSGMHKPNAQTVIPSAAVGPFFATLPIGKAAYIWHD
jgi:nucleotidyltransferase/DNA polymerase involved in DNA repair